MLAPSVATALRHHLTDIPRLCAWAYLDLIPSTSTRYGSIHTARLNAPAPVNEQVLTLLGPGDYLDHTDHAGDQNGPMPAAAVLRAWANIVTGRWYRGIEPPCAVLLERWPATTGNDYSWRLAEDIGRLHTTLEAASHQRARRISLALLCPGCHTLGLYRIDGQDVQCDVCPVTMSPAEYDRRAGAYADKIGA